MMRSLLPRIITIILMLSVIQGTGCALFSSSTYERAYESVSETIKKTVKRRKSKLNKKVLVLPVIDQAGLGEEKLAALTDSLVDLLKKDSHHLIYKADQSMPSTVKERSPRYGIVIDSDLAKSAEELGMNTMVSWVMNPLEVTSQRKGIWPFRKTEREMEVSILINAVDIMNGTLLLTNLESRRIKLEPLDPETPKGEDGRKEISDQQLDEILSEILEDQVSAILDELGYQPWSGRVISANGETIMINAGKDVGITEKSVFEVFDRGDPIVSASGRTLFLLGHKAGEIKISKIMDSHSSATPLTGGAFKAGQVIIIKD